MDVQFQIRQNAMEMQEYMKELFDWQTSIKKKERSLMAKGAANPQSSTTPAPRGRASGAVAPPPVDLMQPALGPKGPARASKTPPPPAKAEQPDPSADDKKNAVAHTYSSYRKWDKLDIDAMLASDDDEPGPSSKIQGQTAGGSSKASGIGPSRIDPVPPTSGASPSPATAAAPVAPLLSKLGVAPASSKEAISITARDPAIGFTEDLLKPVGTTRISKPTANGSSTNVQQDKVPDAFAAAILPPIRNTQPATADAWRARGNDLFKAGEYESAYECYSRSVGLQPTCLGHANRAMALLKLRRWQEAVEECTRAIELDSSYVKAYQRRAAAHRQLGASLEAARDWEQALRLEPENRATATDRDASLEQLLSEGKLQPPSRRTAVPVSWVLSPRPQPASFQQQPQQQGQEHHAPAMAVAAAASPVQRPPAPQAVLPASVTGVGAGVGAEAVGGAVAPASDSSSSIEPPAAVEPSRQLSLPLPQQQEAATTGMLSVTSVGAATAPRGATSAATAAAAAAAAAKTAAAGGGGTSEIMKSVPRTSIEFEASWRSMAGDLRRQAAYLAAIPPASLPAILKNSLTAPVLASLVRCLLVGMMPPEAVSVNDDSSISESRSSSGAVSTAQGVALLEGMTRVARFDLMVMSVPSKERQELRAGWEGLLVGLRDVRKGEEGADTSVTLGPEGASVIQALEALRRKYRI
ncbi:hypothetical protein VaNZ11_003066 [Volvox africanus]|uniref:RNA-polymerase II-associated protein 3-like C-terminal domain-containing protein n=1 Tax=Volvox africanus TaxID=51714 RepID=A0ABQ5RTG2_9CHLO|nr:hypothetical protein VaNZ11_003066 [Volvox africanus]